MHAAKVLSGFFASSLILLVACTVAKTAPDAIMPSPTAAALSPEDMRGPEDLPYYDVAWAKALTIDAMHVRVMSRAQAEDADIIEVQYDAFDQPIATEDGVKVVRWRQRGWLILPRTILHEGKAVALNIHDVDGGDKDNPRSSVGMGVDVARAFGIPVLIHGWMPDVVADVDGRSFHDTQVMAFKRLLAAHITSADELPMDGRYLFNGNPLAKADMVSMTLLQRLVQQERGEAITEIGSMGISKEGASHWILGALDDRVTVLGPGGYYAHDAQETYDRYGKDTDWRFPWKDGDRPEYDGLRDLFATFWKFLDWQVSTDAGRLVARTTTDPVNWYSTIKARQVLVFGDLGTVPGQHDGPWPFWAENKPLSSFKHPSWRYVRAFDGSGVLMDQAGIGEMGLSMLPQLSDALVNDTQLPGTPSIAVAQVADRQVEVSAKAKTTPGLAHEALLLYAISSERGLRDPGTWQIAPMTETGSNSWTLQLPPVPDDNGLTFIVVVREKATAGDLSYWRSASSMPMERFPVPQFNRPGPNWTDR
ncbi:MAG: hypothetical protein R3C00_05560 [Hyphomonas sp.]|nr:hypothetical protein [Hyphomonas sp.]